MTSHFRNVRVISYESEAREWTTRLKTIPAAVDIVYHHRASLEYSLIGLVDRQEECPGPVL
jgi:hypothetical protein